MPVGGWRFAACWFARAIIILPSIFLPALSLGRGREGAQDVASCRGAGERRTRRRSEGALSLAVCLAVASLAPLLAGLVVRLQRDRHMIGIFEQEAAEGAEGRIVSASSASSCSIPGVSCVAWSMPGTRALSFRAIRSVCSAAMTSDCTDDTERIREPRGGKSNQPAQRRSVQPRRGLLHREPVTAPRWPCRSTK